MVETRERKVLVGIYKKCSEAWMTGNERNRGWAVGLFWVVRGLMNHYICSGV